MGLNLLKKFGARRIAVQGDSELVIKQVNGEYIAKHPRLRAYRNDTLDLLKNFVEYELVFVPRNQNVIANGLACLDSSYPKTPPGQKVIIQTKDKSLIFCNIICAFEMHIDSVALRIITLCITYPYPCSSSFPSTRPIEIHFPQGFVIMLHCGVYARLWIVLFFVTCVGLRE